MMRLLNPSHSILDYTTNPNVFIIPSWIILPPEVRDAMVHLEGKATLAILGMKSLMVLRDNRYFRMCPEDIDPTVYKVHISSMRRLLEWRENWDMVDQTLATAAKIPREILHFYVDSIAYGRFASEYATKVDDFMRGPFQIWRQSRIEVEHLAFRLMGHMRYQYDEWRAWWEGQFATEMWEWESCLEGLILPPWEEVIDDVYLMIKDRVEDSEELAHSFHISNPSSSSASPV